MNELAAALLINLAKYGPKLVAELIDIAHKPDPTREDFDAVFERAAKMDYDQGIRDAEARAAAARARLGTGSETPTPSAA